MWIVSCRETSTLPASATGSLGDVFTVWITRVELTDHHGPSRPISSTRTLNVTSNQPVDENSMTTATSQVRDETESTRRPTLISVRRCASALRARSRFVSDPNFKHLPHGDNGDGVVNPHPDLVENKFWSQRKRFFTKFDEGIQLDGESWYSVTPEVIANYTSRRMTMNLSSNSQARGFTVLDAFGGAGGNTIAFCLNDRVDRVVHVDTDLSKIRMAANNCRVYGIPPHKVLFLHANACHVLKSYKNGRLIERDGDERKDEDEKESPATVHGYAVESSLEALPSEIHAVFLSPPWGGPDVVDEVGRNGFGLESIAVEADGESFNGEAILGMAHDAVPSSSKRVAFYLPRSANGKRFAMSAIEVGFRGSVEFEENILNCKLKTITAYLGQLVDPS
jgi:trimethylguanosine synthase